MTTKFRPIIFLSIALLVSFAAEVRACQCAEYETPTCANYWRAGYVFIARVKSINRDPARPYSLPPGVVAGSTMTSKYKTAYLEIERVLRGEINGEVLDFVSEGSDCLIEYKRGRQYIIFAEAYDSRTRAISTSICAGSRRIDRDDASYVASLRRMGQQFDDGSIFGRVLTDREKPMTGIPVLLRINEQTLNTVSDKDGNFRFSLTHGGRFTLKIEIPFEAFDGGYREAREILSGPAKTVLEYAGQIRDGACDYKTFAIVKLPPKP